MINETINQTAELSFEHVSEIMTTPPMILATLAIWLIPLLLWIVMGALIHAKSSGGRKSKPMICYPNFWLAFALWFFVQAGLILILLTFPFWLRWVG